MEYFDRAVDYLDKAKRAMTKTETEAKMSEALSRQNWGPSSTQMRHIANLSFDYQEYSVVMSELWTKIEFPKNKWKQIFKALVLLEFLVKHGAERVVEDAQNNIYKIKSLKNFSYKDDDGREKGTGVRENAKKLIELLEDDKGIRDARKQAKKLKNKYTGLGNNGVNPKSSYDQYDSYDMGSGGRYRDEEDTQDTSTKWDSSFNDTETSPKKSEVHQPAKTKKLGIKLKKSGSVKKDENEDFFSMAEVVEKPKKVETSVVDDLLGNLDSVEISDSPAPLQSNDNDLDPFATLATDMKDIDPFTTVKDTIEPKIQTKKEPEIIDPFATASTTTIKKEKDDDFLGFF